MQKNIKNKTTMAKNDTKMTALTSKQPLTTPIHGFKLNNDVTLKNNEILPDLQLYWVPIQYYYEQFEKNVVYCYISKEG